jgi:hypothetical protein
MELLSRAAPQAMSARLTGDCDMTLVIRHGVTDRKQFLFTESHALIGS